jgi:hypothetical protein
MIALNGDLVRGPDPQDREAIRKLIERQLAAFADDDGELAFSFASPSIQKAFGTPANFLRMVEESYPAVYRPRSVHFGELLLNGPQPTQMVHLVGPDGVPVVALYLMQKQPDGEWRCDGCFLMEEN